MRLVRGKSAMIARGARLLVLAALTALHPGCAYYYGTCNTLHEPVYETEYLYGKARNWWVACLAYRAYVNQHPDLPCSKDFGKGFRKGVQDYLMYGGDPEPPPMPPICYWSKHYQFPEGHRAIEDWFEGYRHGTAWTMEAGFRNLIVVPASVDRLRDPDLGVPPASLPGGPDYGKKQTSSTGTDGKKEETLPFPPTPVPGPNPMMPPAPAGAPTAPNQTPPANSPMARYQR